MTPIVLTAQASAIERSAVHVRTQASWRSQSTRRLDDQPRSPESGGKPAAQTTGLTPAAQRREWIDAGRVADAPRHSQRVAADEMSISDREPCRLTTGEPCLLAAVAGRATCRARARPA